MKPLAPLVLVLAVWSCADVRTDLVPSSLAEGPGRDAGMHAPDPGSPVLCGERPCKCADGEDNDRDQLIDGQDPECTTPLDDNEETFATSDPKQPLHECEDCFWDDNDSTDDDGCAYPAPCRTEGPTAMPGPPAMAPPAATMCRSCEVSPRCADTCRSHTPNGCDCFGCCEVTGEDGTPVNVVLSDECAVRHVGNMKKCPRCVPNPACFNPCGPCELCFGKTQADIPATCTDGGAAETPGHECDDGYRACSPSEACAEGFYCVLGCCMVTVF